MSPRVYKPSISLLVGLSVVASSINAVNGLRCYVGSDDKVIGNNNLLTFSDDKQSCVIYQRLCKPLAMTDEEAGDACIRPSDRERGFKIVAAVLTDEECERIVRSTSSAIRDAKCCKSDECNNPVNFQPTQTNYANNAKAATLSGDDADYVEESGSNEFMPTMREPMSAGEYPPNPNPARVVTTDQGLSLDKIQDMPPSAPDNFGNATAAPKPSNAVSINSGYNSMGALLASIAGVIVASVL